MHVFQLKTLIILNCEKVVAQLILSSGQGVNSIVVVGIGPCIIQNWYKSH